MRTEYEAVCYELLRPAQVKALRERCPIVYIPAGSLEWHGVQNPLGTDGLKAHAICCTAAVRHGGVVLPPFYLGLLGDANWGPPGWEGFTVGYHQPAMQVAAFTGLARGLALGGWKVLVGVTGHDVAPQREALQAGIDAGTEGTDARGFAVMEGELHQPDDDLPYSMDHAGAWETSCMLYAWPEKVDLAALRRRITDDVDRLEMSGSEGIGGFNPLKYASAELGEKIITRTAERIAEKAAAMLGD